MPRADLHPEYDNEHDYLTQALEAIGLEIERLGSSSPNAAYMNARIALHDTAVKRYKSLQIAYQSPFIGRIDLQSNGYRSRDGGRKREKYSLVENHIVGDDDDLTDGIVAYYIGEVEFQDKVRGVKVIGWETPLANLFYEAIEGDAAYETQTRSYRVTTFLKRNLTIKQQRLLNITDDFDTRPNKPAQATAKRDQAILESLADRRAGYLDKITGTIDRDQNRLIRADRNQVMLIQGVAGSGKSIIAQYRLAYLYKTSQGQLRPEECIIFGPNRLFLDYASRVLPSLQVENIVQTTFADWACEQIGLQKYRVDDAALNATLTAAKVSEQERYRHASQLKNSKRMGQLIQRYVEHRKINIALPATGISIKSNKIGSLTLTLNGADLKSVFASTAHEQLTEHRQKFIDLVHRKLLGQVESAVLRIANMLRKEGDELIRKSREVRDSISSLEILADDARKQYDADLESQGTADALDKGAQGLLQLADYYKQRGTLKSLQANRLIEEAQEERNRRDLSAELLKGIEENVESFWSPFRLVEDYRALLANKKLLAELGKDIFDASEIESLNTIPQPKGNVMDVSDVAALLHLYTYFNGLTPKYKHIILDEAQDISSLQYEGIRRSSQNGSVTILGDLAQSIYDYRGISNWDEVRKTFADFQVNYTEITQSYRNTFEIMSFANAILSSLINKSRVTLAKPFDRHDRPPQAKLFDSEQALHEEVVTLLKQLKVDGMENVALIVKTSDECRRLSSAMNSLGYTDFRVVLNGDFDYQGGVIVIPVHLAKGLEFEVVIVPDASPEHYAASDYDTRLLYVAATRALHELHLFAVGKWTTQIMKAIEAKES